MLLFTEFIFCCSRSYLIAWCYKLGFCSVSQSLLLFSFTKSVSVQFHKVFFCSVSQSPFLFSFTKFVSVQVLVSCGPGDGCHGGDASAANEWIHKNGITDETCSIYQVLKIYFFRSLYQIKSCYHNLWSQLVEKTIILFISIYIMLKVGQGKITVSVKQVEA